MAGSIDIRSMTRSPSVLLLVDFINPLDFDGAEALAPSAVAAARATARLRRQLGAAGVQVVFANDNYGVWRSDFKALVEQCQAAPGAPALMAKALRPRRQDFTILKPRHSAFYSTPLDLLLRQLKCRRIILAGLAADSCVLFSAMDAYLRGYSLWIPSDCVAAESESGKQRALEHMRRILKASTRPAFATRAASPDDADRTDAFDDR